MMTAMVIYFLFAVSGGDMTALTPLAQFDGQEACEAGLAAVNAGLSAGQNPTHLMCVASDALSHLAGAK